MFHIVASNNHELALPVKVEGINSSKPGQSSPAAWKPEPPSEG
ncbi:MAG TPA: hypothetical protein VL981_10660 [Candidatus Methylacidiphilales bacterium]|nr:hypothetical protein [Candidatus Methylacidiphilales bacterium]